MKATCQYGRTNHSKMELAQMKIEHALFYNPCYFHLTVRASISKITLIPDERMDTNVFTVEKIDIQL